ncbi:alpha-galactosidase [Microbacterium sp. GXS0129]|uniref:alpha-galactosidase n=1 Tax=Microbacterium sp. GXS0129 TaxID=3377836 RepID=UPI00383B7766
MTASPLLHLRRDGVSVLLDVSDTDRLPTVLHWGQDLGPVTSGDADYLRLATARMAGSSLPPTTGPSLLPASTTGWLGQPGLVGHRNGSGWSPRFTTTAIRDERVDGEAVSVEVEAIDRAASLMLVTTLELRPGGLLRLRHLLRNTGESAYSVERLTAALPVGADAAELLDMTGRHALERVPVRLPFETGVRLRESRRGRPGADAAYITVAGERGFGFRRGRVWGVHLGWSGNQRSFAERLPTGERMLAGGELLLPGEIELAPGEDYVTPWLYASFGADGLDSMSVRFHRFARSLPHLRDRPRPVTFNSWEAMGFDMTADRLIALAESAAQAGAERFVIDDGWFGGRRDDRSSLGDWHVSPDVFPDGLERVTTRIRELGMEPGLWFEPEMINEDSDLARAHPEWLMRLPDRVPIASRHQQVLDLTNPDAWSTILAAMSEIIERYDIGYVKWDHNRDLIDAGVGPDRVAGTHAQTRALYALLRALRERFPRLAIEACASGGARIDLGILEHSDRFWTSDSVDPVDRQAIQRWTALVMPPEILGAHVGAPVAGSTRRHHRLNFRAGTALLGDFGIEWDLSHVNENEIAELAEWVGLYRAHRDLLRQGTLVHGDDPTSPVTVTGVVDADCSVALYAVASVRSDPQYTTGRIVLPGLDPDARYLVTACPPAVADNDYLGRPAWLDAPGVVLPGRLLATIGVEGPTLWPEEVAVLTAIRAD